jgi:CubicO group peptidase (beta-lactamase class C family)
MFKRYIPLFTLLFTFLSLTLTAQESKISRVDSILGAWYGEQTPSVSVLVTRDGEVEVQKSYGYADLAEQVPASAQTNYDLATLTEQFTMMGVLMLQEEGLVNPETAIKDVWPELPDYCEGITIDHLLDHTSGLPVLKYSRLYDDIRSIDDVLAWLKQEEGLLFKPGSKAGSNPVNYTLLADLIVKRSGEDYRDFVEDRIFEPLGMEDSRVYKKGWFTSVPSQSASYYRQENEQYEPAGDFPKDYLEGAIGVFSNLEDMQKWMTAWQSDTLIERKTLNQAMRINFKRGQKVFPGYGWVRGFNKGSKYLYRGGIGHGNSHIVLRVPEANIDVVILSNQSSLFGLRERAFELVNLFSEKTYEAK